MPIIQLNCLRHQVRLHCPCCGTRLWYRNPETLQCAECMRTVRITEEPGQHRLTVIVEDA